MAKKEKDCIGYYSLMTLDQWHALAGLALKYILYRNDWDYSGNINLRSFKGKTYAHVPSITKMISEFQKQNTNSMLQQNELIDCVKILVGWKAGLHNKKLNRKRRKNRITVFRKKYVKISRKIFPNDPKVSQGIVYFSVSIKSQFLTKQ